MVYVVLAPGGGHNRFSSMVDANAFARAHGGHVVGLWIVETWL